MISGGRTGRKSSMTSKCVVCSSEYEANEGNLRKGRGKTCGRKCGYTLISGERNKRWVGESVTKAGIHLWVNYTLGRPKKCEICGTTESPKFEWSNKDHTYTRDREKWQRVCKKCHLEYDIKYNNYNHYIPDVKETRWVRSMSIRKPRPIQ